MMSRLYHRAGLRADTSIATGCGHHSLHQEPHCPVAVGRTAASGNQTSCCHLARISLVAGFFKALASESKSWMGASHQWNPSQVSLPYCKPVSVIFSFYGGRWALLQWEGEFLKHRKEFQVLGNPKGLMFIYVHDCKTTLFSQKIKHNTIILDNLNMYTFRYAYVHLLDNQISAFIIYLIKYVSTFKIKQAKSAYILEIFSPLI